MSAGSDRLTVGMADAIRCALGLLLPAWGIPLSLIVGLGLAFHHGGRLPMNIGTFLGFGFAVGVEVLRRVVLSTRPTGGARATRWLRVITTTLLLAAVPVFLLLLAEALGGGFAGSTSDCASLAIALTFSSLSLLAMPLGWTLLRRSPWLRPRSS